MEFSGQSKKFLILNLKTLKYCYQQWYFFLPLKRNIFFYEKRDPATTTTLYRERWWCLFACDEAGHDFIVYDNCMSHRLISAAAHAIRLSLNSIVTSNENNELRQNKIIWYNSFIQSIDSFAHAICIVCFISQSICTYFISIYLHTIWIKCMMYK